MEALRFAQKASRCPAMAEWVAQMRQSTVIQLLFAVHQFRDLTPRLQQEYWEVLSETLDDLPEKIYVRFSRGLLDTFFEVAPEAIKLKFREKLDVLGNGVH